MNKSSADLRAAGYPVGPDNDMHLARLVLVTKVVACAWGANARGLARPVEVLKMLRGIGADLHALAFTADGIPRHPLYLRGDSKLQPLP